MTCPFERELQNKSFIRALSVISVKKSIRRVLEGICSMQRRTGVAKHVAGVKKYNEESK